MPTQCYYHSGDLDGKCSGAIVKRAIPDVELIPFDYGQIFPWDRYADGCQEIYMVDVSLPASQMKMLNDTQNLHWIDHHEPIINELESWEVIIQGKREVGKAACELCWQYFFANENVPTAVYLLGRYDVWDLQVDQRVLPFQWGMRLNEWKPYDPKWEGLFSIAGRGKINNIVHDGNVALKYQAQQNAELIDLCAFEGVFEGLPALIVNQAKANSQVFESRYDPKDYKLMIAFYYRADHKWVISLYSTHQDIHCGEICKKYSGGGHKGAAGFICDGLPNFEKD